MFLSGYGRNPVKNPLCPRQTAILNPMRLVGILAQTRFTICFILRIIPIKPNDFAIAFKGQNMRGDAIQKPAVVADEARVDILGGSATIEAEDVMTNEEMLREIEALPLEAKRNLQDFLAFLRTRYQSSPPSKPARLPELTKEKFVGMWRDREDMQDSSAWGRNVRWTHWANR